MQKTELNDGQYHAGSFFFVIDILYMQHVREDQQN